uniref:DAGKc domain-containing protein n=1 Tax=Tetradesmus obliquus TaxID=3088 RepID=A0A383VX74_TETOB|eukprot:jgi/Sobl393_1/14806/SZX69791.1
MWHHNPTAAKAITSALSLLLPHGASGGSTCVPVVVTNPRGGRHVTTLAAKALELAQARLTQQRTHRHAAWTGN